MASGPVKRITFDLSDYPDTSACVNTGAIFNR